MVIYDEWARTSRKRQDLGDDAGEWAIRDAETRGHGDTARRRISKKPYML